MKARKLRVLPLKKEVTGMVTEVARGYLR